MILAIDPSISKSGYAIGTDSGVLMDCGLIKTQSKLDDGSRYKMIAFEVEALINESMTGKRGIEKLSKIVVEDQFVGSRSNQLSIKKIFKVAGIVEYLASVNNVEFELVYPAKWMGKNKDKKARFEKTVKDFSSFDVPDNNVADAIGIYLWATNSQED
jgi:Holliday junction resolvasome RuvABC endonuclease subunit